MRAVAGSVLLALAPLGAPVAQAQEVSITLAAPGTAIEGSYLVVLEDGASETAQALTEEHGGQVTSTWKSALKGFAVKASEDEAKRLAADPAVRAVAQNAAFTATDVQYNPPSWGIDRIDQPGLPLDQAVHTDNSAATVHAYVIDSGIRTTHRTFEGRASWGVDLVDGSRQDCAGHGTHVAGTIGGKEFGVAKDVKLVAVRVLDCDGGGTLEGVVSGVDWVTANAVKPAVVNMSLSSQAPGGPTLVDDAIRNSIGSGLTYALSAGNRNADSCTYSPARVTEAITVGASTRTDARAGFSNYGPCVDLFAPGEGINSADAANDTGSFDADGTSMAAPHVAGAAALVLGRTPNATPAQVQDALKTSGVANVITNPGTGSPRTLLQTRPAQQDVKPLIRYWRSPDHYSSATGVGRQGYTAEGSLGGLRTTPFDGGRAVYRCTYAGWDSFTSIQPDCEGHANEGVQGYAHTTAQPNTHPLYRCFVPATGDHMDSTDPNCEGQVTEGLTGHVLN
ncbi:S8 family peptidase [Actinosynnema pretiosum]|uniref:S8 family peptidase n=2 Tax=Actinosynnema TaxID=40566 RepID=UPI0015A633AB|nr:S8 family peptidase [Actinosynnema pretiosum]